MGTHKLVLDDVFDKVSNTLIAIHCSIEDYRLVYLVNKHLGVKLARKQSDIDYNNGASIYSIFEWRDDKQLTTWNLVSNVCKTESVQKVNYESLFNNQEKIIKTTNLIPEHKRVNFFLKIDTEYDFNEEKEILNSILKIPQITTAYSIDTNQLKTKDNLIFC